MATPGQPAAGYKVNTFQEIKSHSSILFNERLAILFYILDIASIKLNKTYSLDDIQEVRSTLYQIYKNTRTLIRNNPTMRVTLNLETKDPGIYTTDVAFGLIDKLLEYCQTQGYTARRLYIIANELNRLEVIIKDILQYYNYFIRPDFRQKPDIEVATEKYKEISDKRTVEELKEIVGRKHHIDFEGLGSQRIELIQKEKYDEEVDGVLTDEDKLYLEEDEPGQEEDSDKNEGTL